MIATNIKNSQFSPQLEGLTEPELWQLYEALSAKTLQGEEPQNLNSIRIELQVRLQNTYASLKKESKKDNLTQADIKELKKKCSRAKNIIDMFQARIDLQSGQAVNKDISKRRVKTYNNSGKIRLKAYIQNQIAQLSQLPAQTSATSALFDTDFNSERLPNLPDPSFFANASANDNMVATSPKFCLTQVTEPQLWLLYKKLSDETDAGKKASNEWDKTEYNTNTIPEGKLPALFEVANALQECLNKTFSDIENTKYNSSADQAAKIWYSEAKNLAEMFWVHNFLKTPGLAADEKQKVLIIKYNNQNSGKYIIEDYMAKQIREAVKHLAPNLPTTKLVAPEYQAPTSSAVAMQQSVSNCSANNSVNNTLPQWTREELEYYYDRVLYYLNNPTHNPLNNLVSNASNLVHGSIVQAPVNVIPNSSSKLTPGYVSKRNPSVATAPSNTTPPSAPVIPTNRPTATVGPFVQNSLHQLPTNTKVPDVKAAAHAEEPAAKKMKP